MEPRDWHPPWRHPLSGSVTLGAKGLAPSVGVTHGAKGLAPSVETPSLRFADSPTLFPKGREFWEYASVVSPHLNLLHSCIQMFMVALYELRVGISHSCGATIVVWFTPGFRQPISRTVGRWSFRQLCSGATWLTASSSSLGLRQARDISQLGRKRSL